MIQYQPEGEQLQMIDDNREEKRRMTPPRSRNVPAFGAMSLALTILGASSLLYSQEGEEKVAH